MSSTLTLPVNIFTWKKEKPFSPGATKIFVVVFFVVVVVVFFFFNKKKINKQVVLLERCLEF